MSIGCPHYALSKVVCKSDAEMGISPDDRAEMEAIKDKLEGFRQESLKKKKLAKDKADLKWLDRRIADGKATRKEVLEAIDLKRKLRSLDAR